MTDEKALFAAICAHPDEDTPRLALADWLEETGTAANVDRAQFIRVQVERAALPPEDDDRDMCDRRTRLDLEWKRLLTPRTWGKKPPAIRAAALRGMNYGYVHHRGFWEYPSGQAADFLNVGDDLFRHYPVGRMFVQNIRQEELAPFLRRPWAGRVRTLRLDGRDNPDWSPLFRAQELTGLVSLTLAAGRIDALPPGDGPANLRHLYVARWLHSPDRVERLLAALPHDRLESLEIGYGHWTAEDHLRLAESEKLANVTRLWFGVSEDTPTTLRAFTGTGMWRRSRVANLSGARRETADHLPDVPPSPGLRAVLFSGSSATTLQEMRAIAASPLLRTVTRIEFTGAWQGADKLEALLASPHLGNLAELKLNVCQLGPAGARVLADSTVSEGLVRLHLQHCKLRKDGVAALLASPRFGRLRRLSLDGNSVRPEVANQLRERFGDGVSV